jgi:hypothetical protein
MIGEYKMHPIMRQRLFVHRMKKNSALSQTMKIQFKLPKGWGRLPHNAVIAQGDRIPIENWWSPADASIGLTVAESRYLVIRRRAKT